MTLMLFSNYYAVNKCILRWYSPDQTSFKIGIFLYFSFFYKKSYEYGL